MTELGQRPDHKKDCTVCSTALSYDAVPYLLHCHTMQYRTLVLHQLCDELKLSITELTRLTMADISRLCFIPI